MHELYQQILQALQMEDKEQAVKLSMDALENKHVTVMELYESILSPALASIINEYEDEGDLIWKEHVRSAIIRTIIESAYPYILKEQAPVMGERENVIVMCPELEDHELGAKMVSDFFQIAGFNSYFIGARTPLKTIVNAIKDVKPKCLVISVTNFYHILSVKRLIENIKDVTNSDLTFILGGRAIDANPDSVKNTGAHIHLRNFEDIQQLIEVEK